MTSGCGNQWGLRPGEAGGCWHPSCPLVGLSTDSLTLSFTAGAAARKAPGMYGEELNCLASGARAGGRKGRHHCSFVEPSPTQPACLSLC